MSKEANCKIIGYGALRDAYMCVTHDGRLMAISQEIFPAATLKCLFKCDEVGAYKDSDQVLVSKDDLKLLTTEMIELIRSEEEGLYGKDDENIKYRKHLDSLKEKCKYLKSIADGHCKPFQKEGNKE